VPGEGVFGLRRAFTVAAARCVITSLWKIPDEQTADLVGFHYRQLCQGKSRASALREAKQHVRKKHPPKNSR
jgi:CHAT domain-containing protein